METRLIELIEKQGFTIEEIACKLSHNGRKISCGNLVKKIKDGTLKIKQRKKSHPPFDKSVSQKKAKPKFSKKINSNKK